MFKELFEAIKNRIDRFNNLNSTTNHVLFSSEKGILMQDESGNTKVQIGYIDFNNNSDEIEVTDGIPNFYGLYSEGAYISGRLWSGNEVIRNITVSGTNTSYTYFDVRDLDRTLLSAGRLQFQKTIIPLEDLPQEEVEDNETEESVEGTGDQVQEQYYNVEKYPLRTLGALQAVLTKPTKSEVDNCNENEEALNGLLNNLGLSLHLENEGKFFSIATRLAEDEVENENTNSANNILEEAEKDALVNPTEEEDPESVDETSQQEAVVVRPFVWRILYKGEDNTLYLNCNVRQLSGFQNQMNNVTASDRLLKSDISYLSKEYINFFDNLKPCTYKMKSDETGGRHIGLIAQDVQEAIQNAGLEAEDLKLLAKDNKGYLGLRYDEILTVSIAKIKQLENRIKELESKINK